MIMIDNELILNKRELESAIGQAIAVIYRLEDELRWIPIKCDYNTKLYKLYKTNKYIVIGAKDRYKIENGKLEIIKCYS